MNTFQQVFMSQDVASLEASTLEGKAMKATRYIPLADGLLTRAQAEEAAFKAANLKIGETNCAVLIDAAPHPIWKLRLLPIDDKYMDSIVIEIDAVTGTLLDLDYYKSDSPLEPAYHMYTLHRTWAALTLEEENGLLTLAGRAVLYTFGDLTFDEPDVYMPIWDEMYWLPLFNGNTVHFQSRWSNIPDYQVELDENGIAIKVVELESSGTEALREDLLPGGDGNG